MILRYKLTKKTDISLKSIGIKYNGEADKGEAPFLPYYYSTGIV